MADCYLLLTELEVCTVSYGSNFFQLMFGSSMRAINQQEKLGSVFSFSTD